MIKERMNSSTSRWKQVEVLRACDRIWSVSHIEPQLLFQTFKE